MPQFLFIELPAFRIKDRDGNAVSLSSRHLGRMIALLQHVRRGLRDEDGGGGAAYGADMSASLLFGHQETGLWTAAHTAAHHPEENLLLAYFRSFDSPGAYPIVDAVLLAARPCGSCADYFSLGGKQLRPLEMDDDGNNNGTAPFRAKFTPRVDKAYTPVFYLARSLDAAARAALWTQLGQVWTGTAPPLASSPGVPAGEMYYLFAGDGGGGSGAPWYALNGQENMTDAEIAEAISRQRLSPAYWIGR